jgi:hypothetical protein
VGAAPRHAIRSVSPAELTDVSGWAVSALTAATVVIAVLVRGWLRHHFWLGYVIAGLSFVHAAISMGTPFDLGSATVLAGFIVALIGATIACLQVSLGNRLRASDGPGRARVKVFHILIASTLTILGLAHILLDGPFRAGIPSHLGI